MKCPKCGFENEKASFFCENCGTKLEKNRIDNKKIKIIIITLIIVIVVGSGGYFLYQNVFKNDKPEYDTNKQVTKEQTTSLEITPEKMEIDVGENQFIETNLKDVTFKSDDHNIATVSDSGRVKGIKNGTTTITVTAGNQKETCQVTVKSSQAVITAINASSTLMQENYDYSANNLIDQNNSTAWSDGIDGDGIGETLTFVFEQESSINEINILNGYCKSEDLYYKNSRIKKVTLIFDDGEEQIDIEDIYNQSQSFKLANQHQSKQMVLRIDEVYAGNKYSDTCVSEISVK
ncbi:Ig-like domain-containing protein [uncultured Thomasclavelia sp.]|uniref:NADase-type glycan-binding domain-containing protein n=1 Tax=uncultured Thomasclavelia sp. TaxID=3025759 RepID=UPI00280B33F7|nr:Ig-like domain-containing protein [uncultured Thomasclavelia sp.]